MKNQILIFIIIIIFSTASYLSADVIILKEGTIYLGEIKSVSSEGIVIETFGTTKSLSQKEILISDKNINIIQGIIAEIKLHNGSVMKGTIQNYDNEVGLLLKTDYGSITMPAKGIVSIHDGAQKKKYYGPLAVAGVTAGCYFPVGGFNNRFRIQPLLSAFTEINSVYVRGLYFGLDVGYMFMKYRPDLDVRFDAGTLKLYAQYRFLDLRVLSSPARFLSPFVMGGVGMSYIARRDNRDFTWGSTRKNEMDALYTAGGGLDIFATEAIILRVQCSWMGLQQKNALMNAFVTTAGIMYGF